MSTATPAHPGPIAPLARRLIGPAVVAAGVIAGCVLVFFANPEKPGGIIPECPFRAMFGLDCPGCGGSRMVYSLLHFRFADAVAYNAVALALIPLALWAYVAWTRDRVKSDGSRTPSWIHWKFTPAVFIAVMVIWWVVRNLPWEPFTGLRV